MYRPGDAAGSSDASVQGTNDDATVSKMSCMKKGYVQDEFVQYFVRRPSKRSPIINRGYYARWAAMRKLLLQFLDSGPGPKQVLSFGAGFDTTFFNLQAAGKAPERYLEVDFLEVTARKAAIIGGQEALRSTLGPDAIISKERGEVHSAHYELFSTDLRKLDALDTVMQRLNVDLSLPTLLLAECVLIYMDPESSRALVQWAGKKFPTAAFVVYEQIRPDDAFGQQMIRNLESRGCPLLGIHDTPTLEDKELRFTDSGWKSAKALDMDIIYNQHLDPTDVRRIERLEIFDEFEEWHIMQEHYCITYGINDQKGVLHDFGFNDPLHLGSPQLGVSQTEGIMRGAHSQKEGFM